MKNKVLSVMFTDMKGFTESSGSRSRQEVIDLVKQHDALLRPVFHRFDGQIVKTIGDAFLVVYESPTNAVLAGLMVQATLREYNKTAAPEQRIEVRVAINAGEVQLSDDDVFGEPVNIASRINAITEPGEVYFTHAVYLSMNRTEVPSSEVGERILKGILEPVKVYRLMQDAASDQYRRVLEDLMGREAPPTPEEKRSQIGLRPRRRLAGRIAGAVALVAIGAMGTWMLTADLGWARRTRAFANAGGFAQAWQELDARFLATPEDPEVRALASEVLHQQVAAQSAGGNPERAWQLLEEQRAQRGWIPDLARARADLRRSWVATLTAGDNLDDWNQALNLLWQACEEDKQNPQLILEHVEAYARFPQRWEKTVVRRIADALALDTGLASRPIVHDSLLRIAKEHAIPPGHDEDVALLWDLLARHYADEMKSIYRPLINNEPEVEARLYAFGILSRIPGLEISPPELFEYHRLNLFQCVDFLSDFHPTAVKYFVDHWLGKSEAIQPFVTGQRYMNIPVLGKFGTPELDNALPLIATLFYEPCRGFLHESVVQKDDVVLRYNCFRLLNGHQEVTPDVLHRYHLLNLEEYGADQFRYSYPWLGEAFQYLQGTIDDPALRSEAAALVLRKLEEVRQGKQNPHLEKSEELVNWLEAELEKCRVKLGEAH